MLNEDPLAVNKSRDAERAKIREQKARQARQEAIQELQRRRAERRQEEEDEEKPEPPQKHALKFLQPSGKTTTDPTSLKKKTNSSKQSSTKRKTRHVIKGKIRECHFQIILFSCLF